MQREYKMQEIIKENLANNYNHAGAKNMLRDMK